MTPLPGTEKDPGFLFNPLKFRDYERQLPNLMHSRLDYDHFKNFHLIYFIAM